jgi:hypothetical protein
MSKMNHIARVGAVLTTMVAASYAIAEEDKILPPPYVVTGLQTVTLGVTWDEAVIKAALPKGVTPTKEMTGGINIYKTTGGFGLGPYTAGYVWVDLEGVDAPDGAKGRWILASVYGPQKVVTSFKQYYGGGHRLGSSRQEAGEGGVVHAIATLDGGKDVLDVTVKVDNSKCAAGAGGGNYFSAMPNGNLMQLPLAFSGDVCPAEVVSAKVVAPEGDTFAKFQPKKVNWAVAIKGGSVALSPAVARP